MLVRVLTILLCSVLSEFECMFGEEYLHYNSNFKLVLLKQN